MTGDSSDHVRAVHEGIRSRSGLASEGSFTRAGYRALLAALTDGGYAFTSFDDDRGDSGVVLLRHDVDYDIESARAVACIEADAGVRSSYFFLLRSPFYSLLQPESRRLLDEIREMRHWVGLHCDQSVLKGGPTSSDPQFDEAVVNELGVFECVVGGEITRAVSFHNPLPGVYGRSPTPGSYISTYESLFTDGRTKYVSDSNAQWREGDPITAIRTRTFPRLQILTHPLWWTLDQQERPLDTLERILRGRSTHLEAHLRESNDLWRASR